ncbi:hypothetical protein ANCCAN_25175, partial [Ancylostoma caninum]
PTVKHGGGSVLVYGAFSRNGMGPLVEIDGIMDAQLYKDILVNVAVPWANGNMPQGWILQQDNDPKHTSRL